MRRQSLKRRLERLEQQGRRQHIRPRAEVTVYSEAEREAWIAAHPGERAVFIFMSPLPQDAPELEQDL
ncbi:MAG TPA: hypothetical protein VKE41_21140 [Roseiflexaceae bacterium]|nr:hypothetical protein [Roseiflexaceae bacterium]